MEAASELLDSLKPEGPEEAATTCIKAAQEELAEGIREIIGQLKLIYTVDRSELGWKVVEAYESDELGCGDEKAKQILKAKEKTEQRWVKKRKKMEQKNARGMVFGVGPSRAGRDPSTAGTRPHNMGLSGASNPLQVP